MKVINAIQDVGLPASRKRARDTHNDYPLIITMTIDQFLVKRILVDTGSLVNVIFKDTFKQIDILWSRVLSYEAFFGQFHRTYPQVRRQDYPTSSIGDTAHMIELLIVSSLYNCIMGRLALN